MKFSQLVKGAQDTVEKLFSPKKEKTVECAIDEETVPCDTLGDVFYSPEAQGTWGSDALDEVWETMDKIEPLTPPTNK